jgi:hypothetical protein
MLMAAARLGAAPASLLEANLTGSKQQRQKNCHMPIAREAPPCELFAADIIDAN